MLRVIEDEAAVKRYRRLFIKSFKPFIDEKIHVSLGHPGATLKAKVFWSSRLGIWIFHDKISERRYGHAFGIGRPTGLSPVPITCEINFPLKGIDRRIGGALAEDRSGRIFVVHRGKIGGGKKGIGKSLFEEHYRGVWTYMEDGDAVSTVALIGLLNSPRFVRQTTQFVRNVDKIKDIASSRSSQLEITFDELRFREEYVGQGHTAPVSDPKSGCDHSLVVRDLYEELIRRGYKAGNDAERDLLIADAKGKTTTTFRVITDVSRENIQSGTVQLLLANADLPERPRMILTMPEAIHETLETKLAKLGVNVLLYDWQKDRAVFPDLNAVIS